jgi:hypothetical protein
MLLFPLLSACTSGTPKESVPEDTGFAYRDTAPVDETGDTDSASDTDTDTGETAIDTDTGETAIDTDTGDTGVVEPPWLALAVWPEALVVHPGATYALRVVGTDPDGNGGDLPGDLGAPVYTVDDATIASVDADGVVTALAEGTTTIRVAIGTLEVASAITVRADGVLTVTVLDATTGAPLENARVALPFTESVRTDAAGVALLPVTDPGPVSFSAWVDDTYDALTVIGLVGREVTVSVLPKDTDPRSASLDGEVDFSGVADGDFEHMVVGVASGSIQGALAPFRLEDLFADERTFEIYGVDVEAPANLFLEEAIDTYEATALPGEVAVWGLAGPLPIAEVTSGLSGTGDALALLAASIDGMSWGWAGGLVATAGATTTADLAPSVLFDDTVEVSLPPLPTAFEGDEEYFVLVTEERADEGFVVTGLGTGAAAGSAEIPSVAAGTVGGSLGTSVLAYAQVGGVGSGGPVSASVATVNADGALIAPMLQDVAIVDTWDTSSRSFGFTVDDGAHFVRVRLRDNRNRVHDILAPGSWSGEIPNCVNTFGLTSAEIEILSLETETGAYESWLAAGDLSPDTKTAITAARTIQD